MANQGAAGEGRPIGGPPAPPGQASGLSDQLVIDAGESIVHSDQSPLFHAENSDRYDRQALIVAYEKAYHCRLVVLADALFGYSVNVFEDLIFDADPNEDLHLLLSTPGGDGESAVRIARSAQSRCRELTVIVPDQAKSAGTILLLGAHHILLGPTSDLGPIDPQMPVGDPPTQLVSAKDIIAAVDHAAAAIQRQPETYPLHASLLADVTALMVQQARSALARSDELLREALKSHTERTPEEVTQLTRRLHDPLIEQPSSHGAIFGADDVAELGLPVVKADPRSEQWQLIWRLWTKYYALKQRIYEGRRASKTFGAAQF